MPRIMHFYRKRKKGSENEWSYNNSYSADRGNTVFCHQVYL